MEPVDRGFLTDEEIQRIMQKDFEIPRLEMVRDVFIFSCFCGLAYIDVAHLTQENIITLDNRPWIIINRQKTNVQSNIPLLEIPRMILDKYKGKIKENRLLPVLSNQKIIDWMGTPVSRMARSKDQCLPQRDCRPLWHQETSQLPCCPTHICNDVAQQGCSH